MKRSRYQEEADTVKEKYLFHKTEIDEKTEEEKSPPIRVDTFGHKDNWRFLSGEILSLEERKK